MRACSPSSPGAGAFLGAIEDSEWLNQLSNLLQLAGAIVDLIDLQCSSVLVALENGWDYTAQVSVSTCTYVGLIDSSLKLLMCIQTASSSIPTRFFCCRICPIY